MTGDVVNAQQDADGSWQCPTCELWSKADRDQCFECLQFRHYGEQGEPLPRARLAAAPGHFDARPTDP